MEQGKQHITDIIFVLSLFCVFAVLALFVVVLGADVYKGISGHMSENYNARTSVTYVTEKIRQNDYQGYVSIDEVGQESALVITQEIEDNVYETWIYVANGELKEIMVNQGDEVRVGDGQTIMSLKSMELERQENGLVQVRVEDMDGNGFSSAVYMKSGGV